MADENLGHQPSGRMTVVALPEELRGDWPEPQEVEVRIADNLVVLGMATEIHYARVVTACANPECPGSCPQIEYLRLEIGIAPEIAPTPE
jgi:hypothetical protein